MQRAALNQYRDTHWDVVVMGAGAVGCATARELAARGFKTLLLDRADMGAGTSARSSRCLYCGVGYLAPHFPLWKIPFHPLEMWQRFSYARNIMHCRAELVRDMPQRLSKHRFYYPFRAQDQYPRWLVNLGFRLMEVTGNRGVSLNWRTQATAQARQESALVAGLGGMVSAVGSLDEYMYQWPERICVDTALDAQAYGASIRTYTKVENIHWQGNRWTLQLREQAPCQSQDDVSITAQVVVNATGPWVDHITGAHAEDGNKRVIGKKGVNLMVRLPDSWRGQGLEAFSSKGEPFYVFPWGEHHFIGPTELQTDENPDDVRVLDSEVHYILGEMNWLFPELQLTAKDVLHAWCGVRPMSTMDGEHISLPVRAITDKRSPNLVTVTGSYIMMHRHAARLAARKVEKILGQRGNAAGAMRYHAQPPDNDQAIATIARTEHVVCLSDLLRRRLPDGLNAHLGLDRAEAVSRIAAEALGWTQTQRCEEVQRFKQETETVFQRMNLS